MVRCEWIEAEGEDPRRDVVGFEVVSSGMGGGGGGAKLVLTGSSSPSSPSSCSASDWLLAEETLLSRGESRSEGVDAPSPAWLGLFSGSLRPGAGRGPGTGRAAGVLPGAVREAGALVLEGAAKEGLVLEAAVAGAGGPIDVRFEVVVL